MSLPSDIVLPLNYKGFGMIDSKYTYNPNYDIVWSVQYLLSSTDPNSQHGICTFLTTQGTISTFPGHYMGIIGPDYNDVVLAIAFDSTGFFGLSNNYTTGLPLSEIRNNSLIIRDSNGVIYNNELSAIDSSFMLANSAYQTLRFIFCNSGRKLLIDYKSDSIYKNLLSIPLSSSWIDDNSILYPGISLCSPISSTSITPSTFYIKNFHTQGNTSAPTYETIEFIPLSNINLTQYTTVSGITAIPI
jgi:hypothetical protein